MAREMLRRTESGQLSATLTKVSKGQVPQWTNAMPQPEKAIAQPGRVV